MIAREQLVAIIELEKRGASDEDAMRQLDIVKSRKVTSAISVAHGLSAADVVLVPPGSIPSTRSGKVPTVRLCRAIPQRSVHTLRRVGTTANLAAQVE